MLCLAWGLCAAAVAVAEESAPSAAASQTPAAKPASAVEAPAATSEAPDDPRRIAAKVVRYAQRVLRNYDRNGNGQLEAEEWGAMHGTPRQVDLSGDGLITLDELTRYVTDYGRQRRIRLQAQAAELAELPPLLTPTSAEPPATTPSKSLLPVATPSAPAAEPAPAAKDSRYYVPPDRLPSGLPDWFAAKDRDGDGQLTISEFSPKNLPSELQQFKQLDRDGDGVLTATECARK